MAPRTRQAPADAARRAIPPHLRRLAHRRRRSAGGGQRRDHRVRDHHFWLGAPARLSLQRPRQGVTRAFWPYLVVTGLVPLRCCCCALRAYHHGGTTTVRPPSLLVRAGSPWCDECRGVSALARTGAGAAGGRVSGTLASFWRQHAASRRRRTTRSRRRGGGGAPKQHQPLLLLQAGKTKRRQIICNAKVYCSKHGD